MRTGAVRGPRDLARRLAEEGLEVDEAEVRADLRRLGVTQEERRDGPVLVLPDAPPATAAPTVADRVRSDPDWPLQVVVVAVAALFVLVGLVGWAMGGAERGPAPAPVPSTVAP